MDGTDNASMRTLSTACATLGLVVFLTLACASRSAAQGQRQGPAPLEPPPPISSTMPAPELGRALDGWLAALARDGQFAGVVVVAREGLILFEKGYGLADRGRGTPIVPATRFNIASIGKIVTKSAIGQLVGAGTLALADTIGARLPAYPNPDARAATIEQLLTHRGGIADFFGPRFDPANQPFGSNADYFKYVAPQPLLFAPGTRNQYCNGCYVVLGEIIAAISGMPYERYVETRIFAPAGMKGAGFLSYADPDVAMGYTTGGGMTPLASAAAKHGRRGSAAGGAFMRAADLLAFDNALRERRLMDARMTAWVLNDQPATTGRSPGAYAVSGGAPGANGVVEANGRWTIIVLGNLDPPNASRVGAAIMRSLR